MKSIEIKEIVVDTKVVSLHDISERMDTIVQIHSIAECSWDGFPYKPSSSFKVAYRGNRLYLKFYIQEQSIRAENSEPNSKVYEDSCVEFFVSPQEGAPYYNFEFNCIGACLAQHGSSRHDRVFLNKDAIRNIRRDSSLGSISFAEKKGDFRWEIVIELPAEYFLPSSVDSLKNQHIKANFYKCGDKLEKPHYLTWNPVATIRPDFHRPEYFGHLFFI